MNTPEQERLLIEEAASAWRPTRRGGVSSHPAWHDLSDDGRERAFEVARDSRSIEAALDPEGLSSTARAVLGRIGL